MTSELVTTQRIFPVRPRPPEETARVEGRVIAVVRYLGVHCGIGGQVIIPNRLRAAAGEAVKRGLVQIWFRHQLGAGLTTPFYGLTDRGRRLAGALLYPRHKPRRGQSSGASQGERDVSTR